MNEKIKFEVAIKRLEEIVSQLEKGQVDLDESLNLFQEGVSLIKTCEENLKEVDEKTAKILEGLEEKDF